MGLKKVIKRSLIKINHKFSPKLKIKDKKIIITGSNSGIGLEITKILLKNNQIISIVNKRKNEVDKIKNNNLQILQQNLEENQYSDIFTNKIKEFRPNIVINCAATFGPERQNFLDLDIEKFNKVLNVNFFSILRILQYTYLGNNLNQVVNITSQMGSISQNKRGGFNYYRLSKTLINAFSKNLDLELKNKNINVFCICPGSVKTKMNSAGLMPPEVCAQKLINIISKNNNDLSGKFINLNEETIQW